MNATKTPKRPAEKREIVKPLKIDSTLMEEIRRVGAVVDLNDADTMRQALRRGLPLLEKLLSPAST